jgi:membrane associated rhomboid family serine protease
VILRSLILLAVVVAGLVASAGVLVVGLTYSAHTVLEPHLGAAGATGAMVGVVAILLGGAAAALFALSRSKKTVEVEPAPSPSPIATLVETVSDTVRERPVVMLLAAVGAGVMAIRNPTYLASAARAFIAPRTNED